MKYNLGPLHTNEEGFFIIRANKHSFPKLNKTISSYHRLLSPATLISWLFNHMMTGYLLTLGYNEGIHQILFNKK